MALHRSVDSNSCKKQHRTSNMLVAYGHFIQSYTIRTTTTTTTTLLMLKTESHKSRLTQGNVYTEGREVTFAPCVLHI